MAYKNDQERIEKTHNAPRFFVEHPQVSWVLLIGVLIWGWFGYNSMPQRKDPDIPVRVAVAFCSWPGATAQQVEQFVTRPIEDAVAENKTIHPGTASDYGVRSVSLPGAAYVYVQLAENITDVKRQFSDINLKLTGLRGNTQHTMCRSRSSIHSPGPFPRRRCSMRYSSSSNRQKKRGACAGRR